MSYCVACKSRSYGNVTGCDCFDELARMCDICASMERCGRCGNFVCTNCGNYKFPCCGQVLCGSSAEDDENLEFDACRDDHEVTTLPCGHDSCTYYTRGCYTCNHSTPDSRDVERVKDLIEKLETDEMKQNLLQALDDSERKLPGRRDLKVSAKAAGSSGEEPRRTSKRLKKT